MKLVNIIQTLLIFLICLIFFSPASARCLPQDCLRQISEAVDNGDSARFEELVDMDGLMASGFDAFLEQIQKPETSSRLSPMLALVLSQLAGNASNVQSIRAMLLNEAKAFVLNGIESGAFAGKKLNSGQASGLLAPLFSNASLGRKEIRHIGQATPDGDGWLIPFSVHDYGNDHDYEVIGRINPTAQGCRLTGIANFDQILNQIQKEAAEY